MPALNYRWCCRAHGVRGLERNVLSFAGIPPVRETRLGMVDAAGDAKRQGWLDRMRDCGRRLILTWLNTPTSRSRCPTVRGRPHFHENGLGNPEMAVSLASSHFQHVDWK